MIGLALKLLPAWAWRWLAIIGVCTASVLAYNWWEARVEQRGYARAESLWEAREAKIEAAAHAAYADEMITALKRAVALQEKVDQMTATRTAMEAQYAKDLSKARTDVRTGAERLRCPARTGSTLPAPAASTAAADPQGPGPVPGAYLVPEDAEEFVGIGGTAAKDVRDYNALLTYTRMIRAACLRPPGDDHGTSHQEGSPAGPGAAPGYDVPELPALPQESGR